MEVVIFLLVVALACLVQGVLGFANALVATPLALIFLQKETVVSSMLVVGLAVNAFMAARICEPINYRPVFFLFLASLLGMPFGVWVLTTIPINWMKLLVGTLVVVFTVLLQFGKLKLPHSGVLTTVAGFLSGLLNTSTSMAGPPVLILLAGQNLPKDQFRKTLVSFFFLSGLVASVVLILSGVMTLSRARYGLISIPVVFAAAFIGDKIAARVPQRPFRALALATLFAVGVYSVVSGLT